LLQGADRIRLAAADRLDNDGWPHGCRERGSLQLLQRVLRGTADSSGDFPPEIGEPGYLGLNLAPSTRIAVPRLADAPWAMECKIWKVIDVNGRRKLILGEGVNFYIRDELWDGSAMRVHMDRYHPVGRMFADRYCRTDDRIVFPPATGASGA
jgi:flavin reductase (DIM6/NTAB) family NADH-FMN oxidoreductase RutF